MRVWIKISTLLLLGGPWLAGCASSKQDAPRVYERQVLMRELAASAEVDNAYLVRQLDNTSGRFACSLAIAKYAPGELAGKACLVTMTFMEEAGWVEAVRGLIEVSDLQFLSPASVVPNEASVETLCRAAYDQKAALLLLYLPNRYGPNTAQVLGVLYDAGACQPVALIHSSAQYLDDEGQETPLDDLKGDHRDRDASYQAMLDYEGKVVKCLGALIDRDAPAPSTQPHRWRTPASERWWVP